MSQSQDHRRVMIEIHTVSVTVSTPGSHMASNSTWPRIVSCDIGVGIVVAAHRYPFRNNDFSNLFMRDHGSCSAAPSKPTRPAWQSGNVKHHRGAPL